MSRAYIVTRNGGTVTKAPINDNKIPIYDTEQDAESDLANLAEGQIYATKEGKFDVDDMKDYIRKQNVLSDWESITISTDSNNPTVMRYDGFLIVRSPTESAVFIYVNGVNVIKSVHSSYQSSVYEGTSATLPIKKNDQIYKITGVGNTNPSYVAYYKLRDYTDR